MDRRSWPRVELRHAAAQGHAGQRRGHAAPLRLGDQGAAPAEVGEVYVATERPKGEIGFYIISDGSSVPYRLHYRAPSFVNLQILPKLAQGAMLADMVALIGTIDIVLGSVDR